MKQNRIIIYLGVVVIVIAVILLAISLEEDQGKIIISAEEVHQMIARGEQFILPSEMEKLTNSSSAEYVFIDLRTPEVFVEHHLKGAKNIPYQRVLDKEHVSLFKSSSKKVLYADSEGRAVEIWILLTQTGVDNLFVLKGGLPYWREKVEGAKIFGNATVDDEKPRYDFKKELSGGSQ